MGCCGRSRSGREGRGDGRWNQGRRRKRCVRALLQFQRCATWILLQDGSTWPWILQRQVSGYQGREARKEGRRGQRRRWQCYQERQEGREEGCQRREEGESARRRQRREEGKGGWRSQERKNGEEVIADMLQTLLCSMLFRCVTL